MSTTFSIQSSSEAQIDDLAFYISRLRGESEDDAPYVKEIQALVETDKNSIYSRLAEDVSILLTKNDREVEHAFNLSIVIILGAPESVLPVAVKTLVGSLTKTESSKTSLKQKILLNLYNALPNNSPLRYDAFLGLVDVTAQADELDSLTSQLANVDTWAKQWGIDLAAERQLYQYLSEKLDQAGEKKTSLEFLLKKLATYETKDDESITCAKKAILSAIDMENYFAFESLIQYTAVQHIKDSEEFKLLDLFLNGNLQTYETFVSNHPGLVPDQEAGLRKMRLLSLASLGSENLARELSYAEISKALMIKEDEVEMWVIDVIRAGLVEAKLDQLNKTVIVHRSIYRVFGKEQWQQLSARLNTWKDSLNDILAVIGNAKLIAGGALQGGAAVVVEDKSDLAVKTN
ncbi:uncharacterized protein BX664DRAFT_341256 [Halteromyces radiatus]|uniref:uncharacterized protein n=1 Tax=Halteromyces radiatus TaxID=101107 RepID=UPI00222069E4|nr:uncharacterized protein BX664DRAFT_341256 [Halteromyces radiatus]KAI8081773.1 hypothetical protein BX664DRAFT_341256 [Halteromyces radiatus]